MIRFLTYQSDPPRKANWQIGIFNCGQINGNDEAARALVSFGDTALPDLEAALDSIEKNGEESDFAPNASWLLQAYATIKGHAAYPRLRSMLGNRKLAFLRAGLDPPLAIALGLTSYVSSSRFPSTIIHCYGHAERSESLDQLILAFERDDSKWIGGSLGPSALATLNSALKERTWAELRADVWHGKSGDRVAVGYRFGLTDTIFTNRSGVESGHYRVTFLNPGFLVDNSDILPLLRLIASCAASN